MTAQAAHLRLVPRPDEWDDVLDTSDILDVTDLEPGEVEVHVEGGLMADLVDDVEQWADEPTREVQLAPRTRSGFFRRAESEATILDAAMFVTDLKRRHAQLHVRLRNLETARLTFAHDPPRRAALGLLTARFADIARLIDALGALTRAATGRGALELFVPSRPLAAFTGAAYTYAEGILGALASLAAELAHGRPDWSSFYGRATSARGFVVPELFEEVRSDLAMLALQLGDKPVARVSPELRKAALVLGDVDAALAAWLG